jgi:hypothetical protein
MNRDRTIAEKETIVFCLALREIGGMNARRDIAITYAERKLIEAIDQLCLF